METCSQYVNNTVEIPVRGFLHRPLKPSSDWMVLTHGAGSNSQSPLLRALSLAFAGLGINVLRCDLPFRQSRPHGPPPRGAAERDQDGLRAAVEAVHQEGATRVFLAGHSYGGRQASLVVAADPTLAAGLLLLSYPLHPPKRPTDFRTKHFSGCGPQPCSCMEHETVLARLQKWKKLDPKFQPGMNCCLRRTLGTN